MGPLEPLEMRAVAGVEDREWCARVMSSSEPWITLKRGFQDSLEILSDPDKDVFVAWLAGSRVGFVMLNFRGPFTPYLQTICVAAEGRGRGLGTRMLGFVEQQAFSRSPNLFLCVSSFNPGARRLYERLGFETIGVLRDYVVSGHDEILMRKTRGPLIRS